METFQSYMLLLVYIFLSCIIMALILQVINKKRKIKSIELLAKLIGYILLITFCLFFIGLISYTFLTTVYVSYAVVYKLINFITKNKSVSIYISITSVLIFYAYIPHVLGYYIFKLLNLTSSTKTRVAEVYRMIVELIRVKLIIYCFAFLIVLITSIETYMDLHIIKNDAWNEVRPFVLQAVVTFIAYDRFHKAFWDEFTKIKVDLTRIYKGFKTAVKTEQSKDVSKQLEEDSTI
ncbi:hypothetical protein M2444_004339 [Paenibacillus sp. PastF-3]|uniref:hypothetical protein n=1 Tax=Paenibacillus sp. PastF-3 TaxID=2940626 RepID=UPI002476286C|nr:hypothetical protein [Paenibacillus sp. PastF-3]MDH6372526.1 hypothetical protein [Paenibacillus sp. PastF-3]